MNVGRLRKMILLILTLVSLSAKGQLAHLSPKAEISIITCGPWQGELYSAFGHTAIRVFDPENRLDDAYNYGVFDFNQPNFYLNYTRGLLYFKLGVYGYPDFRDFYVYYNRAVTEQVLNLSLAQKQAIYNYLEWNAKPENETYRYDYFYNNCSSRVRDVFADVLKDSIQFDGSYITTSYSIRQLTDLYLKHQPWGDLGIDICLGLPMDIKAAPYEYMFLPDFLESGFDHATLRRKDGTLPVVKYKQQVYVPRPAKIPTSLIHPWYAFGGFLILTLALSVYDIRRKKLSKWFDVLVFGIIGLIGALLFTLWTATDHRAAANNFNLLWALPTHLAVFAIYFKRSAHFLKKYFLAAGILSVLLLLSWYFLPQQMHIFLIPFVFALMCRSFIIARML